MDSQPLLEELLALLHTVNRLNRNLVRKDGRGDLRHLSAIQMQAIIVVRHGGVMNMSVLAEQLLVTRPQLTKVIDALVEMGLLARRENPESRREVLIEMTGEGKRFIEERLLGEHSLLAQVLASVGEEEVGELREAVRTMRRVFAKVEVD